MRAEFEILGVVIQFQIFSANELEETEEIIEPRLTTSDHSFGFSGGDPAFPEFEWEDDEDANV